MPKTKQTRDERLARESFQKADAWARSLPGTPYGSRTPTLPLEIESNPVLDEKALQRVRSQLGGRKS